MKAALSHLHPYVNGPLPLHPDNFTSVSRTPWGGTYITQELKKNICPDKYGQMVGESWELSCESSFPSLILGTEHTLEALIQKYPKEMLSKEYVKAQETPACEILVKILNAADDLSLQIHPPDDDVFLKPSESGKHESWFVIHAEEGAGLYLGFQQGVTWQEFSTALRTRQDIKPYLHFIPVKTGDFFEIPHGTCHAVGKGLVLIEPQRVLHGKKGKTYRIYDWGRLYNERGEKDSHGKPRELHVEESLKLINPEKQSGKKYIESLRGAIKTQTFHDGLYINSYGNNSYYKCHRVRMRKKDFIFLDVKKGFSSLIPMLGYFSLKTEEGKETYWQKGQSAFLPSACFPLRIEALEQSDLFFVSPQGADIHWYVEKT